MRSAAKRHALSMLLVNSITCSRLAIGALTPFLFFSGSPSVGLWVAFAYIFLSDVADGALARSFGAVSRAGSIFDYVTDRFNFYLQLFILCIEGVPIYVIAIFLVRDLVYIFCQVYVELDRITGTKALSFVGTAATYAYVLYLNLGRPEEALLNVILAGAFAIALGNLFWRIYSIRKVLVTALRRDLNLE